MRGDAVGEVKGGATGFDKRVVTRTKKRDCDDGDCDDSDDDDDDDDDDDSDDDADITFDDVKGDAVGGVKGKGSKGFDKRRVEIEEERRRD